MNSTNEGTERAARRLSQRYVSEGVLLERVRRRLDGQIRRLADRMDKYDVRMKAIEFKLNFIWAVTLMLLAVALGLFVDAVVKR